MYLFRFIIDMFCVSFYHIIPVLLALVVLGLVSSVPSQEISGKNVAEMTYSVSSGTYSV